MRDPGRRPPVILAALVCGAAVAALLTLPAAPADVLAGPEAWIDDTTVSWTPVADASSYVVLTEKAGGTGASERVASCCSWRSAADAATAYFVRSNRPGSRWSRAHHRPDPTAPTTTDPDTTDPVVPDPNEGDPTGTVPPSDDPTSPPAPTTPPSSEVPTDPTTPPTTTDTSAPPTPTAPSSGTAATKVCDAIPARYPTAPAGAVVVDPAVVGDLSTKTINSPAGTTFWLRPGTHRLGTGEYDQVAPKDGNTYLGAPGAVLDGQGKNDFAFTQQAKNVTISNITVQGFTAPQDQGVVNHDSGAGWTIRSSTIQNNRGAGLMAGPHQQVLDNCLRDNGQYAMNAYKAGDSIVGLLVQGNEIVGNNTDDWEAKQPGCGCAGGIKFWAVNGADVRGNWVHGNHGPALWADTNNNDFLIEDNLIEDNDGEGVFYEISYNLVLRDNILRRNALVSGKEFADRGDNFPEAAVYLSESGGDARVPARTAKIEIYGNTFDDNWSGITAWENADRYCNSPANSSTGYCTKLVRIASACSAPAIAAAPLNADCRWKTQNVDVHDNRFVFDPKAVGCTNGMCGRMALLSNYGSYPSWSPYKAAVVQNAITFTRGNRWHDNSYSGPWTFMPFDTSRTLTSAQWQSAPYGQDTCSNFTGGPGGC